jgi:hypothetical protein
MRPGPTLAFAAAVARLALSAALGSAAAEKPADRAPAELRREVAQLRLERDVSAGKGFYLRLDVARQRLALMLQGVTLDDYGASGLEVGVPEVLFLDRAPKAGWEASPISTGRLDPERQRDRIEVVAPAPAASARPGATPGPTPSPPAIPKSAEETVSVPSPYRVVFAEGVSLEVRSTSAGARNRSWARRLVDALGLRLSDLASALGLGARERVRLRVTLADEDAAALYRSLPPDVGLVVAGLGPR